MELQENLITDLWKNNLWLFGIVEGKESKSYLIWALCWRIFFLYSQKPVCGYISNDPAQRALEKSTALGRRWILKVFAAWGTIMWNGAHLYDKERIIVIIWAHRGIKWKHHKKKFPDVGSCREAKNVVLLPIIHAFQKNNFEHHSSELQIEHKGKLFIGWNSSETESDGKCKKNLSIFTEMPS